jgi:glycosyltransferase involved in cell wall biosynthesis
MNPASLDSSIAVLIPCYNEAPTIGKVVRDFKKVLPQATVYVFDNNSSDGTEHEALAAGAVVLKEKRQGKGFVIASMLQKVEAEYYILVDGDDTYPAEKAMDLLTPLFRQEADMVVGQRLSVYAEKSFRPLHFFGNKLVRNIINTIFSAQTTDILSGYRAFTRELAENLPVVASGFDVETEMTLQLLYRRFLIREIPVAYRPRPKGSVSKLRTFHDGIRILIKILGIFKAYKPMTFFGVFAIVAFLIGSFFGSFVLYEYVLYRKIYSVPEALLSASCIVLGFILASIGVTLHTINFRILEMTNVLSKQIGRMRTQIQNAQGCSSE